MKRFNDVENKLSEEAIRSFLSSTGRFSNMPVLVSDELPSTNDAAKEIASQGLKEPLCVIADSQTAGRGRLGRSFYSPAGRGLFLTLAIPFEASEEMLLFTRAAAVATRRAIDRVCDLDVGIKWVNDIIYKGKKAGGILSESYGDVVIVGVGINCFGNSFPSEIEDIAISLSPSQEAVFDRNRLASEIIYEILTMSEDLREEKIIREYEEASTVMGKRVQLMQKGLTKAIEGVVTGFSEDGGIVLDDEYEFHSGEITLRM